jgi:hypothetical protein
MSDLPHYNAMVETIYSEEVQSPNILGKVEELANAVSAEEQSTSEMSDKTVTCPICPFCPTL